MYHTVSSMYPTILGRGVKMYKDVKVGTVGGLAEIFNCFFSVVIVLR
jgi:hypothetical protein